MTNNKSTQRLNSCFKVYCPIPDWSSPGTACCCAHGNLVDALYPDLHHGTHGQGWYIVLESLFISFHSLPAKTDQQLFDRWAKSKRQFQREFFAWQLWFGHPTLWQGLGALWFAGRCWTEKQLKPVPNWRNDQAFRIVYTMPEYNFFSRGRWNFRQKDWRYCRFWDMLTSSRTKWERRSQLGFLLSLSFFSI